MVVHGEAHMRLLLLAAAGFLTFGAGGSTPAQAQESSPSLALVVGVSDYDVDRDAREAQGFVVPSDLANAARDAALVGDALEAAGFEVTRLENPTRRAFLAAVAKFAQDLQRAGDDAIGVFYYAGHGAQGRPPLERDIDNYLIPVDADLVTEADLDGEAVGLRRISASFSAEQVGAVILILDACRNFALPQANRAVLNPRGLAEASAAPGMLIAYSARPGGVADDGPAGGNGPYATALAREIRDSRGSRIEDVLIAVRNEVLDETDGDQQPWENSSLINPVWIGGVATAAASQDQVVFAALEAECEYASFARNFPDSALARLARTRARGAAPCDDVSDAAAETSPAGPADAASAFRTAARGSSVDDRIFRDCADCPEMAAIPGGAFRMGSPPTEAGREDDEDDREGEGGAPRRMNIAQFAVSRTEITYAQYDACVDDGGCSRRPEDFWGRGVQPVTDVAWSEAQEYVAWLSAKAGARYRLLTEAEWEYAARAGTESAFPTGDALSADDANVGSDRTVEVGSYPANAFGLYDMQGNVFEWVEDCYRPSYAGAPRDGSAIAAEVCSERIMRGGSWSYDASRARSANRGKSGHDHGHDYIGFRVARSP
jgi:formylglycine-generating enzyme required for sulfatase activity